MATPEQYKQVTTRHQILIEGVKAGLVDEYLKTVEDNYKLVKRAIYDLGVDSLGDLKKAELNTLIKGIEATQMSNYEAATAALFLQLEELSLEELEFETEALNKITKTELFKQPKAQSAYAESLARPVNAYGDTIKVAMANFAQTETARTSQSIRRSWANKVSISDAVKDVAQVRSGKVIAGSFKTTQRSVKSTINTVTQHISVVAKESVYGANSRYVPKYEWISTLDNKTSEICRSLDGREFEVEKGPLPPAHTFCRSSIAPSLDPEFDFLSKDATRSSKFGPVDADLNYYDWLRAQSAEFQDTVIGPTRGKLLRDGGLTSEQFQRLNLSKTFRPLTIDQMRQKNPLAFENAGL